MHLGRIIGTVVATTKVPSLEGHRLLLVQPEDESGKPLGEPLVAVDTVSAGPGEWVYFVRAREAAKALPVSFTPSDATILGIVDGVSG
jgi:ethanolamine utilization protein EutN